jgi:hypothetical protein
MSDADAVVEAFGVIAELGIAAGAAPINRFNNCWEFQVDDQWWIAMNGHQTPRPASSENGASAKVPFSVDPFYCYIEYNGWPAGLICPLGGTIAAGIGANEDTFIAAIRARIAAL